MPSTQDMSEWYIELKRTQLSDLFAQHNSLVEQIKTLEQHIVECAAELSKENEDDGNTVFGKTITNN
jgi:myo-inositol catabolism protein IolC